jgi:hypothetical protein
MPENDVWIARSSSLPCRTMSERPLVVGSSTLTESSRTLCRNRSMTCGQSMSSFDGCRSSSQNEAGYACRRVAVLLDVGTNF